MTTIEQKINALANVLLAEDEESRKIARMALRSAMRLKEPEPIVSSDTEQAIHDFFSEIGAPPHVIGYRYAVYGLQLVLNKPEYLESVTCSFYPAIAMHFDTTATRVERALRHLLEMTFSNLSSDAIIKHFGNVIPLDKDKPTNACFFARSAIIMRSRLKQ